MSVSQYIACRDCRERLHIAQHTQRPAAIYSDEKAIMEKLGRFLWKHECHPFAGTGVHVLIFASEHFFERMESDLKIEYKDFEEESTND